MTIPTDRIVPWLFNYSKINLTIQSYTKNTGDQKKIKDFLKIIVCVCVCVNTMFV